MDSRPATPVDANRRLVEWSLLGLVIAALVVVFGRQVQNVQGQAELASFKGTLGALRTALVVQHLQQRVGQGSSIVAPLQRNPFLLLERLPINYAGDLGTGRAGEVPAGKWIFDADCACVGYAPLYPHWLDSPSGDGMVWFSVSPPPGPLQLTPRERYLWQGQAMD